MNALMVALVGLAALAVGSSDSVEIPNVAPQLFPQVSVMVRVFDAAGKPVSGLAADDFQVWEDGKPVSVSEMKRFRYDGGSVAVALLVDRSGSMKNEPLEGAIAGAQAFVERLFPEDRVGVIVFGDPPEVLFQFGPPQAVVGLGGLTADGNTALYDAINQGIASIGPQPTSAKALVVLTDGRDEGSDMPLDSLKQVVAAARVPIYGIALGSDEYDTAPLQELADLSGGSLRKVEDPGQLVDVYREIADGLTAEYRLTYQSPAVSGAHQVKVTVTATDAGISASSETQFDVPGAAAADVETESWPSWLAPALAAGALLLFVIVGFVLSRRRRIPPAAPLGQVGDAPLVLQGPGVAIPVPGSLMYIGRDPAAQIVVDDPMVSRRHAKLEPGPGGVWVEDLGSSNGTFVNGVAVTRQLLQPGDTLEVGDLRLVLSGGPR